MWVWCLSRLANLFAERIRTLFLKIFSGSNPRGLFVIIGIYVSRPESSIRHLILSCQLQHRVHHEFYIWNGKRKSNFADSNIAELAHISPWLYERNTLHESPEAIYLIRYSYPRQRYGKSIRYENFMLCSLEVSRSVCEYRKSDLVFERKYRIYDDCWILKILPWRLRDYWHFVNVTSYEKLLKFHQLLLVEVRGNAEDVITLLHNCSIIGNRICIFIPRNFHVFHLLPPIAVIFISGRLCQTFHKDNKLSAGYVLLLYKLMQLANLCFIEEENLKQGLARIEKGEMLEGR